MRSKHLIFLEDSLSATNHLPHIKQIIHKKRWLKYAKLLAPFICEIPTFISKQLYMDIKGKIVELYKTVRHDKENLQKGNLDEEDIVLIFLNINNCLESYFENYKSLRNDAISFLTDIGIIKRSNDKIALIIIFITCLENYMQVIGEITQ